MSSQHNVRKAVFPVAGLGTRFLPATKAIPKEMLTILDKPVIQYAVDEAREAGIEHFIFVTGRNKAVIEDHFDLQYELQDTLEKRGKKEALEMATRTLVVVVVFAFIGLTFLLVHPTTSFVAALPLAFARYIVLKEPIRLDQIFHHMSLIFQHNPIFPTILCRMRVGVLG